MLMLAVRVLLVVHAGPSKIGGFSDVWLVLVGLLDGTWSTMFSS